LTGFLRIDRIFPAEIKGLDRISCGKKGLDRINRIVRIYRFLYLLDTIQKDPWSGFFEIKETLLILKILLILSNPFFPQEIL
jgi:hypothetical protein